MVEMKDGFEKYLIYNDGRIYSKHRNIFIKPKVNKSTGYLHVDLRRNKKSVTCQVHRLVALHYINNDDPENKICVDHINRNKLNNKISNLRWVTRSQNSQNTKLYNNNTSGIKNINYWEKGSVKKWKFVKRINNKSVTKFFLTKQEAICYKFIFNILNKLGKIELLNIKLIDRSGVKNVKHSVA